MSETSKKPEEIGNIFDDFSLDESLKKEVEKSEEESKKDIFYYISKANIFLSVFNIVAVLVAISLF